MAWKITYRNSFLKKFKKLPKNIKNEVLNIADDIQNGKNGEPLKYSWDTFYSWHFNRKPEYRLIYKRYDCRIDKNGESECMFNDIEHTSEELATCNGLIEFVLIDTRENFNNLYKKSKKDISKFNRL